MTRIGQRRGAAIAIAVLILLAVVGWAAAKQIRSPAQIAADTAAPKPSPITVPVVRRTLSSTVIVRGTVRYGAAQPAVLGTSKVKQGSDIVTRAPRRRAILSAGSVAMAVDGRPVFILPGAIPMSRDLHRGLSGPDVRQLEIALARLGFSPGAVDGRYDAATEAAVSAFYLRHGWDPFGPTDVQLDQLRTAEAAAATARDAHLQALNNIAQAKTASPAEVEQARVDAVTARDALDTAKLALTTAEERVASTRAVADSARKSVGVANANGTRDVALADADVVNKRAALANAIDAARVAHAKVLDVPLDSPPSDRDAAAADAAAADAAIPGAQADLTAAIAAAAAARAGSLDAEKARSDAAAATHDHRTALGELRRARAGVRVARSAARIAKLRVGILAAPMDTRSMQAIATAAGAEERRTRAEVARITTETNIQVPANEILFFPSLPVRVDTVKAKRGSQVSGGVMDVTSSRLVVASSLDTDSVKLVHRGDPVKIDEQDLGFKTTGRVSVVADTPGTNKVGDPSRFYMAVTPRKAARALVGASVRLTIAVKSTTGRVLAVPPNALSVGSDGDSRVQVQRGARKETVKVAPGLSIPGLVQVRPLEKGQLAPGDLVIVGTRRA